ncbi:hypothetical protein GLOIN_2v1470195 [Rhizophagus irregularis DAOM 181602=DAOM 197198]|uniref:Uncharacterized protein n=1 Tax=Rhizophagus irregularis (strain DAOM 181602 / DAOM 197198 / MUCL 43194) TaxID=747089 RepID=A0A2P4QX45_RHIID|nr:hypothetical protein GLOIN_2v1470195 [Rhizophagus irregularis DAOM 181602=DAOM 197198]POG82231.1 hypothetical protein GLOIN_2v1470195 [Rhizophagus irregularis DAOM 181602=DAOM 197198]|eukprot:XP_025189097.1 hypothetical protein GLOIN_2v1470195 [Rhizophagus irregularis DAOM 181602=DAOM 197198]
MKVIKEEIDGSVKIEDEASNFPDGIEDEHIVIHESGKVRVRLVDDEDLASVTWTQRFMMDLPIIVDTCKYYDFFSRVLRNGINLGVYTAQQPFSSWMFPKIKVLLCIN